MKKAAVYIRVSTAAQGNSMDMQWQQVQAYCQFKDLAVTDKK